jgi:circadian clock protein KaiC
MAMEFLVRGASQYDEPGVFMSFEESAHELVENVASLGWDIPYLIAERRIAIDYVQIDRSQTQETGEYDLEALFVRLGHAIDTLKAKRVVLDTLEVLFGGLTNAAIVRAEIRRLFLWLKSKGVTAMITAEGGENTITRHGLEEYVSDCVIVLDQRIQNELSTRRLHILKYRGSRHGANEYPFLIEEEGISVLPLSSIELNYTVSEERISTGIDRLDTMLGGDGYFRGSTILISGTAGTGKSSLCAQFAAATCQRGEKCLYIALEEAPNQIIRNMKSIGIDLTASIAEGVLQFHALRPTLYGLEMHLVKIHHLVAQFQPSIAILDPISSLDAAGTSPQVKSFMLRMIDFLKSQQITAILTNLVTGGDPLEQTEIGVSSMIDTWLMLRDLEMNGERNRLIYILKSRGMAHSNQVREFKLTDRGIRLLDVYLGENRVLVGTARTIQEAQEEADLLVHRQEIERKQREIERKRLMMEAQIATLKAEFEAEQQEINRIVQQETLKASMLMQNREVRAQLRQADLDS